MVHFYLPVLAVPLWRRFARVHQRQCRRRGAALKSRGRGAGDIFLLFFPFFSFPPCRRLRFGGRRQERRAGERAKGRTSGGRARAREFLLLSPSASFDVLPGLRDVAFVRHSFLSVGSLTACTLLSRQHRPGRGLLSAFGCYLRNFWRAIALYFLSAQSQAAHCGWFLAVSGCCFPPPPSFPLPSNHQRESARCPRGWRHRASAPRPPVSPPPARGPPSAVAARRGGADG